MEEEAKKYQRNNNNKFVNMISNLGIGHIIVIGIVALFVISLTKNNQDPRYNYVLYFILIGIILVMYFKPSKEQTLLPREVVAKIAQERLNEMVRDGKEFSFDSKVNVNPACHLKYENDLLTGTSGPVSWEVGFVEMVHGSRYVKDGVISIHPFKGIVTGIDFRPMGYTGRESRDRDIIPVGVVQGNIKTSDFSGNKQ